MLHRPNAILNLYFLQQHMSFNEQFDQHGAWRREFALRLKLLSEWMKDHELLDAAVEERLRRLEAQVRSDKVMVAFVAEIGRASCRERV